MKKFTKLFLAFLMAMGAFAVYAEAEHYVYYDGTFTKPQVWAWNETEDCALSPEWPGDDMVKKTGSGIGNYQQGNRYLKQLSSIKEMI